MFDPTQYHDVLTYEDFAAYLNHIFKMTLSEDFKGYRDNFWLQFRDASGIQRCQDTYELAHPKRGPIPVFLIPYAKDAKGMYYQAVFS